MYKYIMYEYGNFNEPVCVPLFYKTDYNLKYMEQTRKLKLKSKNQ